MDLLGRGLGEADALAIDGGQNNRMTWANSCTKFQEKATTKGLATEVLTNSRSWSRSWRTRSTSRPAAWHCRTDSSTAHRGARRGPGAQGSAPASPGTASKGGGRVRWR